VDAQTNLLEVIDALRPVDRLAGGLHGGEQECDQDGDDRNDDE